jgi:sugar O-acyltransferase (sialic acid O-acetyltransferase NeuD family)
MNQKNKYIFGAGGHSSVVYDATVEANINVTAAVEDNIDHHGFVVGQLPIVHFDSVVKTFTAPCDFYLAVGSNSAREKVAQRLQNPIYCLQFPKLIHPSARVSRFASVGQGTFIGDRSVCEANSKIGDFCIINTASVVTHDCCIGDFVHIAPGSVLCGHVSIGRKTLIGANSTVLPGIIIGENCTVGAGSVVTRNVPNNSIVRGEPAKLRAKT